jgi:hypothetical protein
MNKISHTEKLYNLAKLREMLDGNENAVVSMVDKFIKTIPQFIFELNDHIKNSDFEMARKILYNINFSLDILGITVYKNELRKIEEYTSNISKANELKQLTKKLNTTFKEVATQLKEDLKEIEN